jgi:rhamnogalacturonyl hydrolase YesR
MNIQKDSLQESLLSLKKYVKAKDKLWYTIIDDSEIDNDWVSENLINLIF